MKRNNHKKYTPGFIPVLFPPAGNGLQSIPRGRKWKLLINRVNSHKPSVASSFRAKNERKRQVPREGENVTLVLIISLCSASSLAKGERGISKEEIPAILFRMAGIFFHVCMCRGSQLFIPSACYIVEFEKSHSKR